jgi:UDP-2,3-diacylglucosamine pyrophosphatase LpxH
LAQSKLECYKDELEKPGNKPREIVSITKKKEKVEKQIAKMEETITQLEFLAGNPDELVKTYLQSLPINRKNICSLNLLFQRVLQALLYLMVHHALII